MALDMEMDSQIMTPKAWATTTEIGLHQNLKFSTPKDTIKKWKYNKV